jgi:hypothetical protein
MLDGISFIPNELGTMLKLSSLMIVSVVEMYFLRRLESDEGSCAKTPGIKYNVINKNRIQGVFNQFLLVMLKISIYCAACTAGID